MVATRRPVSLAGSCLLSLSWASLVSQSAAWSATSSLPSVPRTPANASTRQPLLPHILLKLTTFEDINIGGPQQ